MSLTFLTSSLKRLGVSPMYRHAWVGAKVNRHCDTQKVTPDFRHSQNVTPIGTPAFSNKTTEKSMLSSNEKCFFSAYIVPFFFEKGLL